MIQAGDKFFADDLRQSVREVCGYNKTKYIDTARSHTGLLCGDRIIYPMEYTPHKFANLCIQVYSDTPSSAIALDRQIRERGIKTTRKFSYKYNLGELNARQVIYDAYRLDWFNQIAQTARPRSKYTYEFYREIDDAFRVSYYYAQYLWAHNPRVCADIADALRRPSANQWNQIIGAILGIGFNFSPDDVYEYSVNHISPDLTTSQRKERYDIQDAFKTEMANKYNIDTGCLVLAPQSRDKLHKIVTGTDTPYWVQVLQQAFGIRCK